MNIHIPVIAFVIASSGLPGCASTGSSSYNTSSSALHLLSGEQLFETRIDPMEIPSYDPLWLPDSADQWLIETGYNPRSRKAGSDLLKLITSAYGLNIEYDSSTTLTAAESFAKRSANCLSYSMLTFALANKAGLDADIRLIDTPVSWDYVNSSQLKFNRHVNVAVTSRLKQLQTVPVRNDSTHGSTSSRLHRTSVSSRKQTIVGDINAPNIEIEHLPTRELKLNEVRSFYFSNRAAELIIENDMRQALAYLNRALSEDPKNTDAWANVGIIYRKANHYHSAEMGYRQALSVNDDNYVALLGLNRVYNLQNRFEEAKKILDRLRSRRAKNPYYHFSLAQKHQSSPSVALKYLDKAIKLAKHEYRFYFLKAEIHARQGDHDNAKKALILAKQYSPASQAERFSSKLAKLH